MGQSLILLFVKLSSKKSTKSTIINSNFKQGDSAVFRPILSEELQLESRWKFCKYCNWMVEIIFSIHSDSKFEIQINC